MFKRLLCLAALLASTGVQASAPDNTEPHQAALVRALASADAMALQSALAQGAAPDMRLAYGETALMRAVEMQDQAMVTALLDAGAAADLADDSGLTALALACERGDTAIVLALLDHGADARRSEPDGTTPLALCARFSTGAAVAGLLAKGSLPDASDTRGQTPLMWAASVGNGPAVARLLGAGAQVNRTTPAGFTPLFFALRHGGAEAAQMLLEAGADPLHRGPENTSALQLALYQGNVDAALLMLDRAQFDLAEIDRNGEQPLHVAARLKATELAARLLALGADPRGVTGPSRITWVTEANFGVPPPPVPPTPPLLVAAQAGAVDIMQLLIEAGADGAFVAENGTNVLLAAAKGESAAALAYALELAPLVHHKDANGRTALHLVLGREMPDLEPMLMLLAGRGANPALADAGGNTPAQIADGGLSTVREVYLRVFAAS